MATKIAKAPAPAPAAGPRCTGPQVEAWKISRLKKNPRQDGNFRPLADDELDRLAEDIRRNGQRTPIEVAPDGTIIDGHQRIRAALKLGLDEVLVIVRHDLAGDEKAIERRMIEANLNRRQLDILDRVRLARRMMEIEKGRGSGDHSAYAAQDLRDKVGAMLGMSGRNVQRYLNILDAPMEVQRAYSEGHLSMKLAERAARLGKVERALIASEIAEGVDPVEAIAAHLPEDAPEEVDPIRKYELFLAASARAVEALDGRVDKVIGEIDLHPEIEALGRASSLIERLIARLRDLEVRRAETAKRLGRIEPRSGRR